MLKTRVAPLLAITTLVVAGLLLAFPSSYGGPNGSKPDPKDDPRNVGAFILKAMSVNAQDKPRTTALYISIEMAGGAFVGQEGEFNDDVRAATYERPGIFNPEGNGELKFQVLTSDSPASVMLRADQDFKCEIWAKKQPEDPLVRVVARTTKGVPRGRGVYGVECFWEYRHFNPLVPV